MSVQPGELPRLAYVGEVPIRSISAGPAVLYRLLETYPQDRLLVCESDDNRRDASAELPGVAHRPYPLLKRRLLQSRIAAWYGGWVFLHAARTGKALARALAPWRPGAILTVAHGFGWRAAAAAAGSLHIPLHVIVHDHWRVHISVPRGFSRRVERAFQLAYSGAASRMLVSPAMARAYEHWYGCSGTVLYPSQPATLAAPIAAPRHRPPSRPFVFGYAGSVHSRGQRRALIDLANGIAPLGARLRIYQGNALETLKREGLRGSNVDIVPFRSSAQLHHDLVADVDALYLPMSFAAEDRPNVELCFPSKLADYTCTCLPLLVRTPAYGTAAEWAADHPAGAVLITDESLAAIEAGAHPLMGDAGYRHQLGLSSAAIGRSMFGHEVVYDLFARTLCEQS